MGWKETLGTVAPTIATAFGGPLAGVAVGIAAKALGLGNGATEDDIANAVASGNPEILLKLKQADLDFKKEMKALDIDLERIYAGDRVSARDLAKANMLPQILLSIVFIGGYFAAMFALHGVLFEANEINPQVTTLFGALIGVFTREMSGIMQFWFGSSSGSKEKTKQMTEKNQ